MKKYEEKFREFCNNTNMEHLSLYQKEVEIEKFGKKLQAQLFEEYLNQPSKSKKKTAWRAKPSSSPTAQGQKNS